MHDRILLHLHFVTSVDIVRYIEICVLGLSVYVPFLWSYETVCLKEVLRYKFGVAWTMVTTATASVQVVWHH